jgi:hypothetical protein
VSGPTADGATGDPGVDYPLYHQDRINLLIHLFAVPLFVGGCAALVANLAFGRWLGALASVLVPLLAFAAQAVGHRHEPNPPAPFAGPVDFAARVLLEQFWRFPRYVATGGWWAAWRSAR